MRKTQSWDLSPGYLAPETTLLTALLHKLESSVLAFASVTMPGVGGGSSDKPGGVFQTPSNSILLSKP